MTDHFSRENEPHQDDLLRCFGCGVMSNERAVMVQPHDPDPSTWEKNPPALCKACEIPTPADALNALTEALLTLDLSIGLHVIQDSQSICYMHTGEIMNRIQKIRRRLQGD